MVPIFALTGIAVCVALLLRWRIEFLRHRRRIEALTWRIHVNGIRGKSTVTRIIAGMLREGGTTTIAKSTGTFAAVINTEGVDEPIVRRGPATILEQIDVARRYVVDGVDALVIECMALKPEYQEVSERMIVRSNIGVLTNVREDHQDVMGETLPEIARSLLSTCPRDGILVTSESDPEIVGIMREVCASKGSRLVVADPDTVTDDEIARFDYIAFKENVCIALAIADLVGIPRDVAMDGMVRADPDPGVLRMKHLAIEGKKVTWANLFAVNDRESMVAAMAKLDPYVEDDTTVVGILNNRSDRERRAIQFADVAVRDLDFDRLVTFGAFEGLVTDRLRSNGYPPDHIINLGDDHRPSKDEIIRRMICDQATGHVLVVGFVNIHTHQAEEMLEYFEHEAAVWDDDAGPTTASAPSPSDDPDLATIGASTASPVADPRRLPRSSVPTMATMATSTRGSGAPPAPLPRRLPRRAPAGTTIAGTSTGAVASLPRPLADDLVLAAHRPSRRDDLAVEHVVA